MLRAAFPKLLGIAARCGSLVPTAGKIDPPHSRAGRIDCLLYFSYVDAYRRIDPIVLV